jgi:hypothetical protein
MTISQGCECEPLTAGELAFQFWTGIDSRWRGPLVDIGILPALHPLVLDESAIDGRLI